MNNCATCKWWDNENIKRDGWGHCDMASSDEGIPEQPESKAVAYDYSEWSGWLETAADFGCVQWEGKNE